MLLKTQLGGGLFVALLLTTCTCATAPADLDAGMDAGRGWLDSGSRDAARADATRDVGRDAPEDGPPDGGPDDPEWVALEGQPEGVFLYVARHPERVLRVTWEDCGAGCLRAVCPGTCGWLGGFVDGERRVAWIQTPDSLQTAVLLDVETGTSVAAWKLWDVDEPSTARLAAPAYGGGRAAISAKAYPVAGPNVISTWIGTLETLATARTPSYQAEVTASLLISRNFVSATHQAWQISPTSTLFLRDDADRRIAFPERGVTGTIVSPRLIGDRVFYELWADHIRVWTATLDEPAHVLIDVTPAEVRNFHTDGVTMTWLQGYDYDWDTLTFARLELWASPYATRAEDLRPRQIRGIFRGLIPVAFGSHWLASQGEGPTLDVIDLRDGSRRSWTPPDGGNVADPPLYATETEVLVSTTVGAFRIDPNTMPIVEP